MRAWLLLVLVLCSAAAKVIAFMGGRSAAVKPRSSRHERACEAAQVEVSVSRRLTKERVKRSMPLTQAWYKQKQINLSKNQRRLLTELFPLYGITLRFVNGTKEVVNPLSDGLFPHPPHHVVLDIGFGLGDSLIAMASEDKAHATAFLGVEIHKAGIASALGRIRDLGLTNVKLVRADVALLFDGFLVAEPCIDVACVFFPDPWPNAERDGERRVIRRDVVDQLKRRLKSGGLLRVATDVGDYADHVRAVMANETDFRLVAECVHPPCVNVPPYRPVTKYERRAADLGHPSVWDFEYVHLPHHD